MVININNDSLAADVSKLEGVADMYVLNGGWQGKIDWDNMEYWADIFPEKINKITSWKPAVRGMDKYY